MNKEEIEKEDRELKISIPLLTQEDIDRIDINMDEMINQFTKMVVKEKDLIIAQYIIKRQQEKIEKLEQKETILDKVTDKLKEIRRELDDDGFDYYAQEITKALNIIEGDDIK